MTTPWYSAEFSIESDLECWLERCNWPAEQKDVPPRPGRVDRATLDQAQTDAGYAAIDRECDELREKSNAAFWRAALAPATTLSAVITKLEFVGGDDEIEQEIAERILADLRSIAAREGAYDRLPAAGAAADVGLNYVML